MTVADDSRAALAVAEANWRERDGGLTGVSSGQIQLPVTTFMRIVRSSADAEGMQLLAALREVVQIVGSDVSVTVQRRAAVHSHRGSESVEWDVRVGAAHFPAASWDEVLAAITKWWAFTGRYGTKAKKIASMLTDVPAADLHQVLVQVRELLEQGDGLLL